MKKYLKRHIEENLAQYAKFFKIILITGARQVGNCTMLAKVLPDIKTFVFDPIQDIYGARQDPDLFLDTYPPPLIINEIQSYQNYSLH